jgi:peptidoglycan/xylan/chitin deacetylase (PgdA/CDA1 family)
MAQSAARLALKIDVDTYRGTREGVPRLVALLQRHGAGATFLFSLGPDHTGRAIRRVFRPGFFSKVSRTSVLKHYGLRTLLYGTLLPGPDIGRRCAAQMRAVRDAGFEVGVHCWDHVAWQDCVARADAQWTERELRRAVDRFGEIFGEAPRVHGAAGWQMNAHALRMLDAMGFALASDARGAFPFVPVVDGQTLRCPQLPTTLPTLDELIGRAGCDESNVAEYLLDATAQRAPHGHVYTLHAELEGMRLAPVFERLLEGWRAQGYELVALSEFARGLDIARLPRHGLAQGKVPGRAGTLLVQGAAA